MDESRRKFFQKTAALVVGAIAGSTAVNKAMAATRFFENDTKFTDGAKFTLLPLPYAYDALEPHIDKKTMEIHHSKHHQAYVNNLNKALETVNGAILGNPPTMENIFNKLDKLPEDVRKNAGGHYNHSLFWTLMISDKNGGVVEPTGELAVEIKKTFASFEEFKKQFTAVAMKQFGSGWAWLVKTKEGKLVISSTSNQDNPLMNLESIEIKGEPILALDVWEHAYYLKNENRRADYIASWWNVVNWKTVGELFVSGK